MGAWDAQEYALEMEIFDQRASTGMFFFFLKLLKSATPRTKAVKKGVCNGYFAKVEPCDRKGIDNRTSVEQCAGSSTEGIWWPQPYILPPTGSINVRYCPWTLLHYLGKTTRSAY